MRFSSKISNAVLCYLDREGIDYQSIIEASQIDEDQLRDPNGWISARDLENLLRSLQNHFKNHDLDIIRRAAVAGSELRVWGLFDSVLRMMPRMEEVFAQPGRLLSYFVSPEPPVENLVRTVSGIEFDFPVSEVMYPITAQYLVAALESLPLYIGKSKIFCHWKDIHLKIEWSDNQSSIFEKEQGHQLSPELLRSIVQNLESTQFELQKKNHELKENNQKLFKEHHDLTLQLQSSMDSTRAQDRELSRDQNFKLNQDESQSLRQNFARLSDYMVRAQQIIAVLNSTQGANSMFKEVQRRVDWEFVKRQFPEIMSESLKILDTAIKPQAKDLMELNSKQQREDNV